MDDFELEIKKEFLNEALMNLEEVESSFMELESTSDPKPLLDKIFRLAHNLKGGSRAVGFGDVAVFTHKLENLVLKLQKGEVKLGPMVINLLLKSNDRLVEMLMALKQDLNAKFDNSELNTELQNWVDGKIQDNSGGEAPAAEAATSEQISDSTPVESAPEITPEPVADVGVELAVESPVEAHPETTSLELAQNAEPVSGDKPEKEKAPIVESEQKQLAPTPASASEGKAKGNTDEVVRVNLSKINMLNDFVGELIVLQSVIQQQFVTKDLSRLEESIRQMIKLSKEIQTISMSLRLLPVKPTLQKLQRAVRDTAQILGKEVKFDIVGEEMEVDKSVIDRLADPLIHIVRNAVDHGLETPEVRKQSGKAEQGNVKLALFNEGSNLVIEVKDDGRGIDTEVIKKKAIEKNLISQSQAYSEKQLINLIFHPGFSTKTETSEISGRGVGMDVVKTNVEQVGGSVDVKSTVGSGSLFRIQIPQSLAVIEGVVVTCGSNRYVVPMSQVQETINIKSQKVYKDKLGLGSCFELRGTVVPLYYLQDLLFKKTSDAKSSGTALLFNIEEHLVAIEVDDVLRAQQIVIKPFSNGIAPQKGWAGACVLGDGLPTLIVDPADLLNGYLKHQNQVGLTSKVS